MVLFSTAIPPKTGSKTCWVARLAGWWQPRGAIVSARGSPAPQIEQRSNETGPLRLLFVGNLIRRKGLHTLLRGLASLIGENWVLEVVGRTDLDLAYTREILSYLHTHGLAERVVMRGKISEEQLAETMGRAQVMTMISAYEGFGIVYLEGLAFGLPAIASTAGGAGEIIEHGKTGWLVSPHDSLAVADRIRGYCRDRATLFAHSQMALVRFSTFPTWDQSMEKIRAYIQTFVG